MQKFRIKDLMVPLSGYATVSEDATLNETVLALEKAQNEYKKGKYKHRAVLILDKKNNLVGKVSQLDILRALEPKYDLFGDKNKSSRIALSRAGFSKSFIESMVDQYDLWTKTLEDTCLTIGNQLKVKDFMYKPSELEHVDADTQFHEAIHMLVIGHHQSLLVTEGDKIIGVLRLTDVFERITELIKDTCSLE